MLNVIVIFTKPNEIYYNFENEKKWREKWNENLFETFMTIDKIVAEWDTQKDDEHD